MEDFSVQQLVAHSPVEAFAISVLPRRPRFDVCGLGSDSVDPISDGLGDELWAIVRPNVGRDTAQNEQVHQSVNDLGRVQLPLHSDRQTYPTMFVQNVYCPERPAIIGYVMYEII